MRSHRFIFRLLVATVSFLLGVASVAMWVFYRLPFSFSQHKNAAIEKSANTSSSAPEISTIDFCEFIQYPESYMGKDVKVRANLITDNNGSPKYFGGMMCGAKPVWIYADCEQDSSSHHCAKISNQLNNLLGDRANKSYMANVEVIGRFSIAELMCREEEPRYWFNIQELKKAEITKLGAPRLPKFKKCRC